MLSCVGEVLNDLAVGMSIGIIIFVMQMLRLNGKVNVFLMLDVFLCW